MREPQNSRQSSRRRKFPHAARGIASSAPRPASATARRSPTTQSPVQGCKPAQNQRAGATDIRCRDRADSGTESSRWARSRRTPGHRSAKSCPAARAGSRSIRCRDPARSRSAVRKKLPAARPACQTVRHCAKLSQHTTDAASGASASIQSPHNDAVSLP